MIASGLGNMKRTSGNPPASILRLIAIATLLTMAIPAPLVADVTVLVPGGTRTIIARSGDPLEGGGVLRDHMDKIFWFPDDEEGRGTLFVNHEKVYPDGGLSRLIYNNGVITERRNWLSGTHFNCSGTISGWGTILTCEEYPPEGNDSLGHVIEVYTTQPGQHVRRKAMGRFSHEAIIEDPVTGDFYMTDDTYTGVFFKFTPIYPGYLGKGSLYAFREDTSDWVRVHDMIESEDSAISLGATPYPRLEGLVYNPVDDAIYIMVSGRLNFPEPYGYILRFDPRTQTMTRWLDCDGEVLANPDNVQIDSYGNLLVHEDQYAEHIALFGPNELVLIRSDRSLRRILRGNDPNGEVSGLAFSQSEKTFWVNWMGGAQGSELVEVRMPPGWNSSQSGIPFDAPTNPAAFGLTASPNPFSATTWIRGQTNPGEKVRLEIFDARGTYWRTLVDGTTQSRELEAAWDGRDHRRRLAPRGYYFARLTAGGRTTAARILLIR
jgi:secreted PhoX family phosphatase